MKLEQVAANPSGGRWMFPLAIMLVVASYLQVITGASMTTQSLVLMTGLGPLNVGGFDPMLYQGIPFVRHQEYLHLGLGIAVWMIATIVTAASWWRRARPHRLRTLSLVAWLLVALQAALGWLRVSKVSTGLAVFHACVAFAFLGLTLAIALRASPGWARRERPATDRVARSLRWWTVLMSAAIMVVVMFGALSRHQQETWQGSLKAPMQMAHIAAVAVFVIAAFTVSYHVIGRGARARVLAGPMKALFALAGAQITLGITTMLAIRAMRTPVPMTRTQAFLPTVHVAVGAAMVLMCTYVMVRARYLTAEETAPRPVNAGGGTTTSAGPPVQRTLPTV